MDWNRDTVLHLLGLIRERPVIWDAQYREYRDKQKKHEAIQDIALLMGCSTKAVNTKWTSMRNQYSREKRNLTGMHTGSGADAIYTTKWYAFKEMEILMDGNTPQETYNNLDNSENLPLQPPSPPTLLQSMRPPPTPTPPPMRPKSSPTSPLRPPSTPTPPLQSPRSTANRNKVHRHTVYKEAMETLKVIRQRKNQSNANADDLTCYGLYIAAHLKKFCPRLQCKAKYEINNILYKLDMKSLDRSTSDIY